MGRRFGMPSAKPTPICNRRELLDARHQIWYSEVFEEVLKRTGIRLEDYPGPAFTCCLRGHPGGRRTGESLQPAALLSALKGLDIITIGGRLRFDPKTGQGTSTHSRRRFRTANTSRCGRRDRHGLPYLSTSSAVIAHDSGP
jgi:hypothetical protein